MARPAAIGVGVGVALGVVLVVRLTAPERAPVPQVNAHTAAEPPAVTTRIRAATLDWPPYTGASMPAPDGRTSQGWLSEVVVQALAREGLEVELTFLPWARALREVEAGRFDLLFPAYASLDREATFVVSTPLAAGAIGFAVRAEDAIDVGDPVRLQARLAGRPLGVVRGYLNPAPVDDAVGWVKEEAADDAENLRKLAFGRVDAVVIDRLVFAHLLRTADVGQHEVPLTFLDPPMASPHVHVMAPRDNPRAEALVHAFDAGLDALEADGSLGRLAAAWNLTRVRGGSP